MKRRLILAIVVMVALAPQGLAAWNDTGHQLVARIAWDNLTDTTKQNAIALLQAAPADACLLDLFPTDARPLDVRQRELFMRAATWSDIVRPKEEHDPRPCVRFNRPNWHFINFFWKGISGVTTGLNRPRDLTEPRTPELNIVERLGVLRPMTVCALPACGMPLDVRATLLAWILHLAGDIHQPLHTSARVTASPGEQTGDQGGNLFLLSAGPNPLRLHGYWDGIVDRGVPRVQNESDAAYLDRVAGLIVSEHPLTQVSARLRPAQFEAWALEGFATTKGSVYPITLQRGHLPSNDYQNRALAISKEAIAIGGYRLADLLNTMFGS